MDSLTQIALGGAIGETVAGEKAGNRAMLWGGVAGLLPDLDLVIRPFYSQSAYLLAHRGISHSIVFAVAVAPLLAAAAHRIHRARGVSFRRWWLLAFLALFTHPLLDIMTTYGTGFLEPFSGERLAVGSINIVDPIYSLPLMGSLVAVAVARRRIRARRLVAIALVVSHVYLAATFANMLHVRGLFAQSLAREGVEPTALMVSPSFFNNILWSGVAVDERHAWIGQHSLLDADDRVTLHRIERNLHLADRAPREDFENLARFSKGFFVLDEEAGSVRLHDLRFGYIEPGRYIFSFDFSQPEKSAFGGSLDDRDLGRFIARVAGDEPPSDSTAP